MAKKIELKESVELYAKEEKILFKLLHPGLVQVTSQEQK